MKEALQEYMETFQAENPNLRNDTFSPAILISQKSSIFAS